MMSNTERDRAQSDQTSDMIDADTGIDAPEDMVAEEVAFVSDDTVEEAEVIAADPTIEPAAQPAPEPANPNVIAPTPAPSASAGTGSMIIGGVIAAAIGVVGTLVFLPEGWRPVDTTALERRIAAVEGAAGGMSSTDISAALAPLSDRIAALEGAADPTAGISARLDTLEAAEMPAIPDLAPLTARVDTLEAGALDTQSLTAALAPMNTRIAQIEADITAQARAAVEAALAEARAEVEAQAASLTTRETDVAAAQSRIAARAALAELIAAAESGEPQPGAMATLAADTAIPADLAPFTDGLVTLAALQDGFAPAARAALDAQAAPPDAPISDRVMNFLRSQTGARSLAPRDGDDTDAVLSRAEAALRQGDLATTLTELDALTGDPAAAMAAWRAQAETRMAALAALTVLQDQFTANEG